MAVIDRRKNDKRIILAVSLTLLSLVLMNTLSVGYSFLATKQIVKFVELNEQVDEMLRRAKRSGF